MTRSVYVSERSVSVWRHHVPYIERTVPYGGREGKRRGTATVPHPRPRRSAAMDHSKGYPLFERLGVQIEHRRVMRPNAMSGHDRLSIPLVRTFAPLYDTKQE